MKPEQSWSAIDPRPVIVYVAESDDYLVYWNGIAMTHSMALCMVMEYFGIFPTPEMKSALEKNYKRLYYSNAFATRAWDTKIENGSIYPYLKRIMAEHLNKLIERKNPKEILGWFSYDRSRIKGK